MRTLLLITSVFGQWIKETVVPATCTGDDAAITTCLGKAVADKVSAAGAFVQQKEYKAVTAPATPSGSCTVVTDFVYGPIDNLKVGTAAAPPTAVLVDKDPCALVGYMVPDAAQGPEKVCWDANHVKELDSTKITFDKADKNKLMHMNTKLIINKAATLVLDATKCKGVKAKSVNELAFNGAATTVAFGFASAALFAFF